jgi:capsular exopolysaccharide synthesis family protein
MRAASLSTTPANKNPKRIFLLAIALGLAAGTGLAFFIEYLDNTIKSTDDLEQRFGVTVLGTVQESKKSEPIESIVKDNARSPISESYRLIRSSLLVCSADHPPRTLLVTSMGPQEGKTTTSINLARTMAQGENKVLLIDADMRKPRIHTMFALANTIGLSSYLSGNSDENIIHTLPEEQIDVIPSGPIPPNPAELLESRRMKNLLREVTETYDFILFDSPPIGNLVDGLILSTLVDGTVLVAKAGTTTYDTFYNGLKKIIAVHTPILGVVLNSMSANLAGSKYYHYYEYYSRDGK